MTTQSHSNTSTFCWLHHFGDFCLVLSELLVASWRKYLFAWKISARIMTHPEAMESVAQLICTALNQSIYQTDTNSGANLSTISGANSGASVGLV